MGSSISRDNDYKKLMNQVYRCDNLSIFYHTSGFKKDAFTLVYDTTCYEHYGDLLIKLNQPVDIYISDTYYEQTLKRGFQHIICEILSHLDSRLFTYQIYLGSYSSERSISKWTPTTLKKIANRFIHPFSTFYDNQIPSRAMDFYPGSSIKTNYTTNEITIAPFIVNVTSEYPNL